MVADSDAGSIGAFDLARKIADQGGDHYMPSLDEEPIVGMAERLGLIKVTDVDTWTACDSYSLTDEGRRFFGLPPRKKGWLGGPTIKTLLTFCNNLFASRKWSAYDERQTGMLMMRRWTKTGWETRPCTAEEAENEEYWNAIR